MPCRFLLLLLLFYFEARRREFLAGQSFRQAFFLIFLLKVLKMKDLLDPGTPRMVDGDAPTLQVSNKTMAADKAMGPSRSFRLDTGMVFLSSVRFNQFDRTCLEEFIDTSPDVTEIHWLNEASG